MNRLSELIKDREASGVYVLLKSASTADVEQMARTHRLEFFHFQGGGIRGKEGFLNGAAAALEFPDYFGHNWDAFEECLTDMSWRPAPGYAILLEHFETFRKEAPADFETLLHILHDAASFWKEQTKSFFVILRDFGPSIPELREIEP